MKRSLWMPVFLAIILLSGCATTNQTAVFTAQDLYRDAYLDFYKNVRRAIQKSSGEGRLSYDEAEISTLYRDMIQDVQRRYDAEGIQVKVLGMDRGEWGWTQKKSYLACHGATVEKLSPRYKKGFLESRAMMPDVASAYLLKRGWDISQCGFAATGPSGETYTLPLLLTVNINLLYNNVGHHELNIKRFSFPSSFLEGPPRSPAHEAEIAAVNWDFATAEAQLARVASPSPRLVRYVKNQKQFKQSFLAMAVLPVDNGEAVYNRLSSALDWIDRNKELIKMVIQ